MSYPVPQAAALLGAYLIGSLSFATILVSVFRGVDVRAHGSGNAGATNVLRTAGKPLALATVALDLLKGTAAVLLMKLITFDPRWVGAAAVAAVLGHIFPVWFAFRGGKGVATALGAFLVVSPLAMLIVVVVFALVVLLTRYVSLGSVTAACVLPLAMGVILRAPEAQVVAATALTALLLISHRGNIARLLAGTERKLGRRDT
jgi:glycerol-3-phosphate acyltransferase PlsY